MKLMFISDIHGSSQCLEVVLKRYNEEKADKLVILGDVLYHGPRNPIPEGYQPQEVIELLNPLKDQILAVRGNCDSEVDQMVLAFSLMGDFRQVYLDHHDFYLSHGHLYHNELPSTLAKGTIYVQGHSHIPMIKNNGLNWHFNPGSITLPKEGHPPTYGIYEDNALSVKTMDGQVYIREKIN